MVSSASNFEGTPLLTECMSILLAEEVQKRLPNLCGSPTTLPLTVSQAHIVCIECSPSAGVEISDEKFLGHGALRLSRVARPVAVIEIIVSQWWRKFQTSPCAVSHSGIEGVAHHKLGSVTLAGGGILGVTSKSGFVCNCRAF